MSDERAREADHREGGGRPADPLLRVEGLTKHFSVSSGLFGGEDQRVRAVDGIDLEVGDGETVGLIGESGCGKSTAALSMLRLQEPTAGEVWVGGESVTDMGESDLRELRRRVQMVFQDPTESFDPRMTVGESVGEPLRIHGLSDAGRRREVVVDLLERVGLDPGVADRYPHALSGGQKQRAALARALVLDPDLLVLDEPVSALDVSVQAEILALLSDLQSRFDLSVLLITHDMGVVRELCDRVAVMYLGEVVERGPTDRLFEAPRHPYTRSLVASIPRPDPRAPDRDAALSGAVPDAADPPDGCRFHTRCPSVIPPERFEFDGTGDRSDGRTDGSDDRPEGRPGGTGGVYPRLIDLRVRVADGGLGPEALDELAAATGQVADPDAADAEARARAVRAEFDLPDELADPNAEAVLADAVEALAAGDRASARERLAAFESVCEREAPALVETDAGHPAACHLHGADGDGSVSVTGDADAGVDGDASG